VTVNNGVLGASLSNAHLVKERSLARAQHGAHVREERANLGARLYANVDDRRSATHMIGRVAQAPSIVARLLVELGHAARGRQVLRVGHVDREQRSQRRHSDCSLLQARQWLEI